ncbi:MAG: DUF503 domain-containing protein [Bacillota bacterium]
MIVGICTIEVRISGAQSLKDKRRVVKSITERVRNRYNVSVAEVDNLDNWKQATIGIAHVSNDSARVHQILTEVVHMVERDAEGEVIDSSVEIL